MIRIEQWPLPAPAAFSVEIFSRAGSEKINTLGQRVFDGRREKRRLDMRWNRMEGDVLARLFALMDENASVSVTYPDPVDGEKQIRCYVVSRGARVWRYRDGAAWADVQLNLEEM